MNISFKKGLANLFTNKRMLALGSVAVLSGSLVFTGCQEIKENNETSSSTVQYDLQNRKEAIINAVDEADVQKNETEETFYVSVPVFLQRPIFDYTEDGEKYVLGYEKIVLEYKTYVVSFDEAKNLELDKILEKKLTNIQK